MVVTFASGFDTVVFLSLAVSAFASGAEGFAASKAKGCAGGVMVVVFGAVRAGFDTVVFLSLAISTFASGAEGFAAGKAEGCAGGVLASLTLVAIVKGFVATGCGG